MSVILEDIVMKFPGTRALDHVTVEIRFDEIHSLIGENGAGKSTLVNVLGGSLTPSEGRITVNGLRMSWSSPRDALANGISHVSQEGNLVSELSGAANILLGDEPKLPGGIIRSRTLHQRAADLLAQWFPEVDIDLSRPVGELAVADQKIIEITRALRREIKIIILDEPTATLQSREKEQLWSIIRSLPPRGVGVVLISHFLSEVLALSDRITVLRDGQHIRTLDRGTVSEAELVNLMLRREADTERTLSDQKPVRTPGNPVLQVSGWLAQGVAVPEFEVRRGEIVGLIGLTGAGHFSFARSVYDQSGTQGEMLLDGQPVKNANIRAMQRAGVAFIPDHRMINALSAEGTITENLSMVHPGHGTFTGTGVLSNRQERAEVDRIIRLLNVKTSSPMERVRNLSGGNKQKVSIGKWLYGADERYKLMIFVEPTEGVDIGAKQEIYTQIRALAASGIGVIIASSDLLEIEDIADRVVPFVKGRSGTAIAKSDFSETRFITAMAGEPA